METIRPVEVLDVLRARDERLQRQKAFLERYHVPLISFTMNIAGSIKYDAAIHRAFREGVERIRWHLQCMRMTALDFVQIVAFTGCEALWAVDADADELKKQMCALEEEDPLGRLFDIDVLDNMGNHLSRNAERKCLICDGSARACARSRTHTAEMLFDKAHEIIDSFFRERFVRKTGELAQKALLYEALTTPKPGLVDTENSGAHSDMDVYSFVDSACALRNYYETCVRLGLANAEVQQLQRAGISAEADMLDAARVNTHKGAIFSLGILCYAMGSCGENAPLENVLAKAGETGAYFLAQMKQEKRGASGGESQYLQYDLTGARGEAASGFQSVVSVALPALEQGITSGRTLCEAGLDALLTLMARVYDSNVIRRAGMEGQQWVMTQADALLKRGYTADDLREMNCLFVGRNISPGGSADLLAVTYFLYFIQHENG